MAGHFLTAWKVLDRKGKSRLLVKGLLLLLFVILPAAFGPKLGAFILEQAENFGKDGVFACCLFLAVLILLDFGREFGRARKTIYPDEHFAFYRTCGMTRKEYRGIRMLSCVPYGVVGFILAYVLCRPFLESVAVRLIFVVIYALLLTAVPFLMTIVKPKRRSHPRKRAEKILLKNRTGAMVFHALADKGTVIYCGVLLVFAILFMVLFRHFFGVFLGIAWMSVYFTAMRSEQHYRDREFRQCLPQTYAGFVRDDIRLSAMLIGFCTVVAAMVCLLVNGSFEYRWLVLCLFLPNTLMNHIFLYMYMGLKLYDRDSAFYEPVLGLLSVIIQIPGISLILTLILRKRNNMKQAIRWGEV